MKDIIEVYDNYHDLGIKNRVITCELKNIATYEKWHGNGWSYVKN